MRDDIKKRFIDYGNDKDSIVSIFYVKSNTNDEFIDLYTVVDEIIIGKLEEELKFLFDDIILINRSKNSFEIDKNKQNYTILSYTGPVV